MSPPLCSWNRTRRRRTACPWVEAVEPRRLLATLTISVTSTLDANTPGTLRYAINQANLATGPAVIDFAIPGTGVKTIDLASDLPQITHPVTIDGLSQGGGGYQGSPLVELVGGGSSAANLGSTAAIGLDFEAGSDASLVRGLDLHSFSTSAIVINAGSVTISGNYIGTNPAGNQALGDGDGIEVFGPSNTIGGLTAADRNVISGNTNDGVLISGANAQSNTVEGNIIGGDPTGTLALGNLSTGVNIASALNNTIGGSAAGAENLITHNGTTEGQGSGLLINGQDARGNDIQGNAIVANLGFGVAIANAPGNLIGGASGNEGNVLSGNAFSGVYVAGSTATANDVEGNKIGVGLDGVTPDGNAQGGIIIDLGASDNTIGNNAGGGNVIAGNGGDGVLVRSPSGSQVPVQPGNLIEGNSIGIGGDGSTAVPNAGNGISINGMASTRVLDNIIAANHGSGIAISGTLAFGSDIEGNLIGTNRSDAKGLGNSQAGVLITSGASNSVVGGTTANTIVNNLGTGVLVESGTGNGILGNSIFQNAQRGIVLGPGANNNQNAPVLTSAVTNGTDTLISGTYQGAPNTGVVIQVFANSVPDPSGFGQGETYLASATVTGQTDAGGTFAFTASYHQVLPEGTWISATSTDDGQNTSEFSNDVQVKAVALSINNASLQQPASGTANMNFVVTLATASPQTTMVDFHTVNGTAIAGRDYVATSGTLTFPPGVTQRTISVPVIGGTSLQMSSTFNVDLTNPQNATISNAQGTGTIIGNNAGGILQFNLPSFVVSQDVGEAVITVNRTGNITSTDSTVSVQYAAAGGRPSPGSTTPPSPVRSPSAPVRRRRRSTCRS